MHSGKISIRRVIAITIIVQKFSLKWFLTYISDHLVKIWVNRLDLLFHRIAWNRKHIVQ